MYKKVSTDLDFKQRELETIEFWNKNNVFERSIKKDAPVFTFFDGPPTANGKPHIGHILTRVMKDIIPRYKTMKGYKVLRKAGWDTHGLPVELEVEKILGIDGKPEIEKYGVQPFIEECKKSVWKYEGLWKEMSQRVGFWADMEDPYVTYHNEFIESVWWALKQIWDKDLIYKGHKVVPYCPRCGTALSSHEVAQGYKDVEDTSAYVNFKVKGKDEYIMAWTTTPWTLPSNVALAVNGDVDYIKAKFEDKLYIVAKELAHGVFGEEYEIIEEYKGIDLVGIEYEPLFDYASPEKKCWFIIADGYVTTTDGTGIVHIAPAFGEDDARVGRDNDLPFVQMINTEGRFIEGTDKLEGLFIKDADPIVLEDLKARGLLFKPQKFTHSYPFCWRCDTPLIYYARATWFISMTKVRDKLLKNNATVNWMPENIKDGRFGNFLDGVIDWGLSRERYWGTPLPIWECSCGHRHMIGSIEELKSMSDNCPDDIELHRPYIDAVEINCSKCGGKMHRVPEVIDCWFDSGSMPFAQWHYPFENKEIFDENFPADFISEAIDQTRGWFYTLMAISTLIFEKAPYKNVIVLGHVQDKDGQKMSKHKGNVVDPWDVLNNQGADAVRWYFYTSSSPWLPNRFYDEAVNECQRKFMGTLWNTYAFYILYADIDNFNPTEYKLEYDKLAVMDKWILSRLNSLIKQTDYDLENYRITESARAIQDFVDELSNWYVRRCRERFWQKDMPQDKINAFMTLYTVLYEVSKLAAPYVPFMTEEIYQNLVRTNDKSAPESIHFCDFPVANDLWIDKDLESNMETVLNIVVAGRAARNTANVKNRQPLSCIFAKAEKQIADEYFDIVLDELNVKKLEFTDDVSGFVGYKFKPQLRTLGPKYGKILGKIGQFLSGCDTISAMADLDSGNTFDFEIDGTLVQLSKDDLLIETTQKEGMVSQTEKDVTIVLDTNLDDALIEEGFIREIISKIQTMRKDNDFLVQDHIKIAYSGNSKIGEIIEKNKTEIMSDTLADDVFEGTVKHQKEWNINGEKVVLSVEVIK
ncbi:MAG: isoleucine--tRNA ligase [Clostridia bacterium]|nr:isoleucine--tRNA ligase [Clostridia bacterium]